VGEAVGNPWEPFGNEQIEAVQRGGSDLDQDLISGSGNSCTRRCWSPPAATRVTAFMGGVASERWVQDLLTRANRNGDRLAS
jgi:hypothetical protein